MLNPNPNTTQTINPNPNHILAMFSPALGNEEYNAVAVVALQQQTK